MDAGKLALDSGSSPLARGTRGELRREPVEHRFIPARAGNTYSEMVQPICFPVHPRSRGEHRERTGDSPMADGSSPLARGTRRWPGRSLHIERFIPARAGNTARGQEIPPWLTVHPRSRGEHQPVAAGGPQFDGSSPLARGTPACCGGRTAIRRFIPARAGNTPTTRTRSGSRTVHPRSRGEHEAGASASRSATGSSPLARGTHAARADLAHRGRFIPARAGNTGGRRPCAAPASVHPRSRGEHQHYVLVVQGQAGSSPLARGTRGELRREPVAHRFIPARAGNTLMSAASHSGRAVHPRSRGEHESS